VKIHILGPSAAGAFRKKPREGGLCLDSSRDRTDGVPSGRGKEGRITTGKGRTKALTEDQLGRKERTTTTRRSRVLRPLEKKEKKCKYPLKGLGPARNRFGRLKKEVESSGSDRGASSCGEMYQATRGGGATGGRKETECR